MREEACEVRAAWAARAEEELEGRAKAGGREARREARCASTCGVYSIVVAESASAQPNRRARERDQTHLFRPE